MEAFHGREHVKIEHLNNFYKTALVTDGWSMQNVGKGDEKLLLERFGDCVAVYKQLPSASREVIADITRRMGQGMALYVGKDLGQGTVKTKDYDEYCHYVAGLVGEGLSRLFSCTGYEAEDVAGVSKTLANTMGLFLQKTNIIRDYLEDYVDGRAFWPQEIWQQYAVSSDLGEFAQPAARGRAVACLNHLVTNALECVPECLEYMKMLHTEEIFRFCAIPQVMAIATLAELYDNPKVFTGVVKIRKGTAASLILDTKSEEGLHKWFNIYARDILRRVPPSDPSAEHTKLICRKIIALTDVKAHTAIAGGYAQALNILATIVLSVSTYHLFGRTCLSGDAFRVTIPSIVSTTDKIAAIAFISCVVFIFGYSIVASGRGRLRSTD